MNQYISTFDISGYETIVSADQNYHIEWKYQMGKSMPPKGNEKIKKDYAVSHLLFF
jgi:hypothetical protein